MIKTAFKAKVVFETNDNVEGYFESNQKPQKMLTYDEVYKAIKSGKVKVDIIGDELTSNFEPVLVITHNVKSNNN